MNQKTVDQGTYRIWLGISSIIVGILMNVLAMGFYYASVGPEGKVFPGLVNGSGEIYFVGTTLLGFGVYKHVQVKKSESAKPNHKTGS